MMFAAILVFLTLCCGTGSLLTVLPEQPIGLAPNPVRIKCLHAPDCSGVTWRHGPRDLAIDTARYRVTRGLTRSDLVIDPLLEEDEGQYFCVCADGRTSGPSNLRVHHLPNFDNVNTNQTFHRGETVSVECNADRGDPPEELVWIRNNNKVLPGSPQMRVDSVQQALIIENISDSNAGVYQCFFNHPSGPLSIDITVNVMDPRRPLEDVFNSALPRTLSVSYGEAIDLDCRNPQADPSVRFVWILHDVNLVNNHRLHVEPENVVSGAYRCLAYRGSGNELQHTVLVTLVDIPPIRVSPPEVEIPIMAREQAEYFLREDFRFRLDMSNLSVEWKVKRNGGLFDFDFGSRFTVSTSQTVLRFRITDAALTDTGEYLVNVSNPYGSAKLRVVITVREITRTEVQVRISELPCDLIQEHEDRIVQQIAEEHECTICGEVRVGSRVERYCDPLDDSTTVTVTLLSQDVLPGRSHIVLSVEGQTVNAEVCSGANCFVSTTLGSQTVDQMQEQGQGSLLVVSVVVVVIVTVSVVLLVLLLTVFIWKTRHCRHAHRVAQEDAPLDQVVVHQAGAQPECTAYARVGSRKPPQSNPDVTPVTLPHPSPPPHIAPLLPPSGAKPACPLPASKAKRPQKLYFRSHSYHGSTRTPQP